VTIEIMLPFYGSSALLREAVDSVLAQDDDDWRLTVIDDAYPDPAAAGWVADLADDRLRYLRNPRNLGVSGSFQKSLDLAEGDWLVVMGGDDRMLPSYVSRMNAMVRAHPEVGFVQPGVTVIDGAGRPATPMADRIKSLIRINVAEPTIVEPREMTESLLRGNWMYFPATCWNRPAIAAHGFEPRYEVVLDWLLQMRLLQDGYPVLLDPEVTFEYRRHPEQVSTGAAFDASRFHEEKALILGMEVVARRRGWRRAARLARWHLTSRLHALQTLAKLLASGRVKGSVALLNHAFTNRWPPGDWPAPDS
jgi:glycosyltransferase involved in cell wall biosynthesis